MNKTKSLIEVKNKTKQNKTKHNKTKQNKTKQNKKEHRFQFNLYQQFLHWLSKEASSTQRTFSNQKMKYLTTVFYYQEYIRFKT